MKKTTKSKSKPKKAKAKSLVVFKNIRKVPIQDKQNPIFKKGLPVLDKKGNYTFPKKKDKKGKIIYRYYNVTDKKQADKTAFIRNEEIKKKLKKQYPKTYRQKFTGYVKEIKKGEKKQEIKDFEDFKKQINEFIKKNKYPKEFQAPVNQSIITSTELLLLDKTKEADLLLRLNDKYFIFEPNFVLLFRYAVTDFLEWFFDALKEAVISPFVIFNIEKTINGKYKEIITVNLDKTVLSEEIKGIPQSEVKRELSNNFAELISVLKKINLYKYIQKINKISI